MHIGKSRHELSHDFSNGVLSELGMLIFDNIIKKRASFNVAEIKLTYSVTRIIVVPCLKYS